MPDGDTAYLTIASIETINQCSRISSFTPRNYFPSISSHCVVEQNAKSFLGDICSLFNGPDESKEEDRFEDDKSAIYPLMLPFELNFQATEDIEPIPLSDFVSFPGLTDAISTPPQTVDPSEIFRSPDHTGRRHTTIPGRRRSVGKSGIIYDAVTEENKFLCEVEGCVDKEGKQKRFKRQEHLKRHVKTAHLEKKQYKCWVPCCKTDPFSRGDNLITHLNTHRKASSRNRYVATLDPHSEFYDPDWRGDIDCNGFPVFDQPKVGVDIGGGAHSVHELDQGL